MVTNRIEKTDGNTFFSVLRVKKNPRFNQVNKGHFEDALAQRGDEGRGTLRKATGRCEQPLIRRCPNGETHPVWDIIN